MPRCFRLPVSGWRLGCPGEQGGWGRAKGQSRSWPRRESFLEFIVPTAGPGVGLTTPLSLSFPACKYRVQGRQWLSPFSRLSPQEDIRRR